MRLLAVHFDWKAGMEHFLVAVQWEAGSLQEWLLQIRSPVKMQHKCRVSSI